MPLTAQTVFSAVCQTTCGENRQFPTPKQASLWVKLHVKKCSVCYGATTTTENRGDILYNPRLGLNGHQVIANATDTYIIATGQ